ncbi:MarR family transcriptional regulator [Natranaerovirga pectinivora]|uniref:MarR family transcriptional regulator n=1 Tax=Natranaerovirga pectinivora TaxID=682400 RepID=A0A4R3MKT2_9FIRM|nr:MarR family winged helix-turn-helix transcriptional regulator [Natranaerovirga pectinivora]TCT14556.1 MarR family transcriptional regulator [Natranaerovirga pectinivora]
MKQESVGRYAAAIYRSTQSIINKKLENYGIRSGQHDFLYVIIKKQGISQTEMCDLLNVGKSTVTKAVNSLVKSGYVIKEKSLEDKRCYQIYLTEKGEEIAPRIKDIFDELSEIYKKNLSEEEYYQILNGLKIILGNISNAK